MLNERNYGNLFKKREKGETINGFYKGNGFLTPAAKKGVL